MAVCPFCLEEMTSGRSCAVDVLHFGGVPVALAPFGSEPGCRRSRGRCGDCGVRRGGFHHVGCDRQRCPLCRRQLLSCGCLYDEDDDGGDGDLDEIGSCGQVEEFFFDANGVPCERIRLGDQVVIVHYDDIPECDKAVVDGIPCTTALRTVIDLAPDLYPEELASMVADCLGRGLFTVEEARARVAAPDLARRPGALLLGELLRRHPGG